MIRTWTCCLILLTFLFPGGELRGEGKIRVLLLDGQNNHNWVETSESLRGALERAGLFQVVTATSPPKEAEPGAWRRWWPDFRAFDVVVSNYNGQPWPRAVQEALEEYVHSGGGLAIVHAANNAFPEWTEYNRMIGLGWRDRDYGDAIAVDDASGRLLRIFRGTGIGAGHGRRHSYVVRIRKPEHPIMKGIPVRWMHATDELYHGQRGPALDMTVLASAYSEPKQAGSGQHEPLVWVIPYGRGRVVTNLMGHHWPGQEHRNSLHCVGFQTIFTRSVEWLARDRVTLPVPDRFPTTTEVVMVDLTPAPGPEVPSGHRLLYNQTMGSKEALRDFVFSDPGAWRYSDRSQGEPALEHFRQSRYEPPHRSPLNIALVDRQQFGRFVVDLRVRQTGREYGHRDLCFFFGFQDPAHFYYAHISSQTDDHAHNIFLVNGQARVKISTKTTSGHDWGERDWHQVRIRRDLESGSIQVFVNDMSKPIMSAQDKTFAEGWIGVGSFDDTGKVSRIRIWSPELVRKNIDFFSGPGD